MRLKMIGHIAGLVFATVALAGCGGSGSGSSSVADSLATVSSLGTTGGSAELSDSAKVTFSSYVLSGLADVSFEKLDSDPGPVEGSMALSGTYQLTIPAGKLAGLVFFTNLIGSIFGSSDLLDISRNFISMEIPVAPALLNAAGNKYVGITIDNGLNIRRMASMFNVSNGMLRFSIPPLLLDSNRQKIRVTIYSLGSLPVALQQPLPSEIGLYRVQDAAHVVTAQTAPSGAKTPLILVHGIQLTDLLDPAGSPHASDAYMETWRAFIAYFFADADLQSRYDLYTFRYNTFDPIPDNAAVLRDEIRRVFSGSGRVAILAHSMGGLVANDFIVNGGASNLVRLITLGTPFHGSQAVHYLETLMPAPMEIFFPLYANGTLSSGARDLHWDGSDGNYVEPGTYLYTIRNSMNSLSPATLSRYHLIAGVAPSETVAVKSFSEFFMSYESLNNGISYDNDGIVASRSALFGIFADNVWEVAPRPGINVMSFAGLNHMQIHDEPLVLDHVKGILSVD